MKHIPVRSRPIIAALAFALVVPALPVAAQSAPDASAEIRLRKLEAEMRAIQRQVFPGGDGKFFAPQVQPGSSAATPAGTPASTPTADLFARMEALEGQLARLTAQGEENANKLTQLEAKLAALAPAPVATPATAPAAVTEPAPVPATSGNLAAMTGGAAVAPKPAAAPGSAAANTAAVTPSPKPTATAPKPAAPKPAAGKPAAGPSAQRLAAVRAVEKPATDDPAEDAYSYGFRLWEAKFHPEAQQQLKLYLDKYPRHGRTSYARNLLGRAYLDDGKPREAAQWFLQNYQADKTGDRAPDSVLFLAEAMNRLKDTNRSCVALAQFADDYPREAAGRLKSQYDATRAGVKCN